MSRLVTTITHRIQDSDSDNFDGRSGSDNVDVIMQVQQNVKSLQATVKSVEQVVTMEGWGGVGWDGGK